MAIIFLIYGIIQVLKILGVLSCITSAFLMLFGISHRRR